MSSTKVRFTLDQFADLMARIGGFVYIASPYSLYPAGLDRATEDISKITGKLIKAGIPTYSPIAHSHTVAEHSGLDKLSHKLWCPINSAMIQSAEILVVCMLEDWHKSKGTGIEIDEFREAGKPIRYLRPTTMEIIA